MANDESADVEPLLGQGDIGRWSQNEAVDYETACEVYTGLIAWCTSEIESERRKPGGDESVIADLMARSRQYVQERRALDPTDHDEIARVIQELGGLLKAHRAELKSRREDDGA
jgi:hypothetical protein